MLARGEHGHRYLTRIILPHMPRFCSVVSSCWTSRHTDICWRSIQHIYIDFYPPRVSAIGRGEKWTAEMEKWGKEKKVMKRGLRTTHKAQIGD